MVIYVGADHRGFRLKETIKSSLAPKGYEVVDCGNSALNPADDYADFATEAGAQISRNAEQARGVLICGSGAGMSIAANKFKNVRAFIGIANDQVYSARHDDDANVLVIPADFVSETQALEMLKVFLETPFGTDERYKRRLDKVLRLEHA